MKILFVSAEVGPFSSVGGLSQVMSFLPKALIKLGHDVRIFTPKYGSVDGTAPNFPGTPKVSPKELKIELENLEIPISHPDILNNLNHSLSCNVKSFRYSPHDPLVYFLENREYYEQRANVYGYADDHVRFALLSKGCLEWLLQKKEEGGRQKAEGYANLKSETPFPSSFDLLPSGHWWPDLIHCNDWHTGYLIDMARRDPRYKEAFKDIPIVYTVHNFKHQGNGVWDFRFAPLDKKDTGKNLLPDLLDDKLIECNALLRGIINADAVNTVSKTHVEEVQTPEYGEGLEEILKKNNHKLFGILNGLDREEFNPARDKKIKTNYNYRQLFRRAENKLMLQKEFKLPSDPRMPLFAISGRMERQKGIEILMEVLPKLMENYKFQFLALGGGEESFRQFFVELSQKYPDRAAVYPRPSFSLPRQIFGGSDVVVMPSQFEPGGIVALEAMRYGAVPLVRRTGGLNDVIADFDPDTGSGNGFSFSAFDPWGLYGAWVEALTVYRQRDLWKKLVVNCMKEDFSWSKAAGEYEEMYKQTQNSKVKSQN
ncbi:glycogen synthase [Candidatus Collierbacteria bacterium]|nr:glycogen synthase [Candidatus Collierbacteria bacterium]